MRQPAIFIGHGNPLRSIREDHFTQIWSTLGEKLEQPHAIAVISAHWVTRDNTKVAFSDAPKTMHDFFGFPDEMYKQQYLCPGSPKIAREALSLLKSHQLDVEADHQWGLDHGAWALLKRMFPRADIPSFQISLNLNFTENEFWQLGKALTELRDRNVLLIGSGNIVHNLKEINLKSEKPFPWCQAFDQVIGSAIMNNDSDILTNPHSLTHGDLAINSGEHYWPLLAIMGTHQKNEPIATLCEGFEFGSISMRSIRIG